MQFRRTSRWVIVGAVLALGLDLMVAGMATAATPQVSGKVRAAALSAAAHGAGDTGLIRGEQSSRPAPMGAVTRPVVRRAGSPNATYRQYVAYSQTFTSQPHEGVRWAEVYCPSGMVATGGGEANSSPGGVTLHDTYALSNGSGWHVDVTNDSEWQANLTVYAVCFSGLTAYTQVTAQASISGAGRMIAGAPCPAGMQSLSGGGWTSSYDTYVSDSSWYNLEDGDHGWGYGANNLSPDQAVVTAQALCGSGIANYSWLGFEGGKVDPGYEATAYQSCPSGTFVVGGGGVGSLGFRFTDSYPSGQGWRIYAHNDSDEFDSVGIDVICGT